VIQKHASNNDYLQVLVNSVTEFVGRLATVGKIVINGSDGADSITINSAVTIPATINGGSGNDTITGGGGADSISGGDGIDSLTGGAANDTIYGGVDGDGIWGGDGNDSLFGDAGNDGIYGDNGNDSITGGSGSDYMSGGAGNDDFNAQDGEVDTLDGGSGSFDTAYVDNDFFNWVFDQDLNIETIFY
jgi:Ca2+-binding RTX toxin-like protein